MSHVQRNSTAPGMISLADDPRVPLILVGKMWSGLVDWAKASMLDPRRVSG